MSEKKVHTLPVMKDDKLVGVIGKSDIIRSMAIQADNKSINDRLLLGRKKYPDSEEGITM